MKPLHYQRFDDAVRQVHLAARQRSSINPFFAHVSSLLNCSLTGLFIFDRSEQALAKGVFAPGRMVPLRDVELWQKDPEITAFNTFNIVTPRRLSELGISHRLKNTQWLRAQLADPGLRYSLMLDLRLGNSRARLISMRGDNDFDSNEMEMFERIGFHAGVALGSADLFQMTSLMGDDDRTRFDLLNDTVAPTATESRLKKNGLTRSEIRVCQTLCDGKSISATANILGVTKNTIKSHLKNIYDKLNIRGLPQLVFYMNN